MNEDFIHCWNEILVPKWNRFRHLLSGNGKIHSDIAIPMFGFKAGDKVLDIGCGYGETCLDIAEKVTDSGEVLGLDCTAAFLDIANKERDQHGAGNVRFELADVQTCELPAGYYDAAFSRFGVMFFQSAVMAMRNSHQALKPDGRICLIVWRTINDNPCWGAAKEIALKHLPPPGDAAMTCGPGPFSMANEETTRGMLNAAGFKDIQMFERIDRDICVGNTIEEAIDYQLLVGPSGEIVREAGEMAREKLPALREELTALMESHWRGNGVFMPSSTWAIMARK